jgi:acyl-CoA hydrolase
MTRSIWEFVPTPPANIATNPEAIRYIEEAIVSMGVSVMMDSEAQKALITYAADKTETQKSQIRRYRVTCRYGEGEKDYFALCVMAMSYEEPLETAKKYAEQLRPGSNWTFTVELDNANN